MHQEATHVVVIGAAGEGREQGAEAARVAEGAESLGGIPSDRVLCILQSRDQGGESPGIGQIIENPHDGRASFVVGVLEVRRQDRRGIFAE